MSSGLSAYTCTPRQIRKHIIRCMTKRLVPFVQSSPGLGKSAIVKQIARDYNLKLIDHRLSTSQPEDQTGLPQIIDGKARYVPFDTFPLEDDPIPAGYSGWLLFLDEFNSADKQIQASSYKLILDWAIGQMLLHPNVVVVCAGNQALDRAIVTQLSTAMQSRLIHLTLVHNFEEWLKDVALPEQWDGRIVSYLSHNQKALMDFKPDHNDKTFCCPRTWEFMNRLLKGHSYAVIQDQNGKPVYEIDEDLPLFAGTITSGVALDFVQHSKVQPVTIQMVVADPSGVGLPLDPPARWMTVTHLMEQVDDQTLDPVMTFINRLPSEFRILFARGLMIRQPTLKHHPAFRKALVDLSRYLNDDDHALAA